MINALKKLILGKHDRFEDVNTYKNFFVMNLIAISFAFVFALLGFYYLLAVKNMLMFWAQMAGTALSILGVFLNGRGIKYVTSILLTIQVNLFCIFWAFMIGWEYNIILFSIAVLLPHYLFSDISSKIKGFLTISTLIVLNIGLYITFHYNPIVYIPNPHSFSVLVANTILFAILCELYLVNQANELAEKIYKTNLQIAQDKSMRDPLTNLWNRHYMQHAKNIEKTSEVVVMIDIDFFKKVNDVYGHDVGDIVLVHLADLMRRNFRKSDTIIRWGGEEFLLILANVSLKTAVDMMNKFKQLVIQTPIILDNGTVIRITFSGGVYEVKPNEDINKAIRIADEYLYCAKKSGRNKIVSNMEF